MSDFEEKNKIIVGFFYTFSKVNLKCYVDLVIFFEKSWNLKI